jgi:CheY-like chemotaxis protein
MSPISDIEFADEEKRQGKTEDIKKYDILVVDDAPEVHEITHVALSTFKFDDFSLNIIDAYSAKEAKEILSKENNIAVVLLDVVMETDSAGLDLVEYIRNELQSKFVQIILRTGQPGQAPEKEVMVKYDINNYLSKSELTAQKLYSSMVSSIRSYQDLMNVEEHRFGLEKVVHVAPKLFKLRSANEFTELINDTLAELLDVDGFQPKGESFVWITHGDVRTWSQAGNLSYADCSDQNQLNWISSLSESIQLMIKEATDTGEPVQAEDQYVMPLMIEDAVIGGIYIHADCFIPRNSHILDIFANHVSSALESCFEE